MLIYYIVTKGGMNMLQNRKYVALLLALVLCLAACGTETADTPEQTGITPTEPAVSETTETPEENLVDITPSGTAPREFVWLCTYPLNHHPLDGPPPNPDVSANFEQDLLGWENAQRVYQEFNCFVTNSVVENVMEVMTASVMAGSPAGDLAMLPGADAINAIISNLIIPYNDFVPATHDLFNNQERVRSTAEMLGNIWTVDQRSRPSSGMFLGVNLDIITSIGAPNPAELYDRGEWTMDVFMDILRLATRDTTGDGYIDQYGISGQPNEILWGLIASNGGIMVTEDFQYGFDHPGSMNALIYANQILGIDKTWNYDPLSGVGFFDWNRHTYAFMEGRTCFFMGYIWLLPDGADAPFDYTAVPFPIGPGNTDGKTFFRSFDWGLAVPRGVQNPEEVFNVWFEYINWYGDDFAMKDEADLAWPYSKFLRERDAERIMDALSTQGRMDVGDLVFVDGTGYTWITGAFAQAFFEGWGTPAQVVEEHRQHHQEMLETVFGALSEMK
jgi:hypothetical protein